MSIYKQWLEEQTNRKVIGTNPVFGYKLSEEPTVSYYTKDNREYDEAGYEALEHRAFQWRDLLMKQGHNAKEALELGWKYVNHEDNKDANGY
jgi:hypothetical protein